ncbi:hypothetical protein PMAYCL1PPCAC_32679, partial [Pristionchus mayeri]
HRRRRRNRRRNRFLNFLRDVRFFFLCLVGRRQPSNVKIVIVQPTPLPSPPSELSSSSYSSDAAIAKKFYTLAVQPPDYGKRR